MSKFLWSPSSERIARANLTAFIAEINRKYERTIEDYAQLHAFSISERENFWRTVFEFCSIKHSELGKRVLVDGDKMPGARWFPDTRLNIAHSLLARNDDMEAVIGLREDGKRKALTFAQLNQEVSRFEQAMRAAGAKVGDHVASLICSVPEAVAAVIATAAVGAVWAGCAPEFGVAGAVDRLGQISPKFLIVSDGYLYGGKEFDLLAKTREILERVQSIETVVVVPVLAEKPDISGIPNAVLIEDFLAPYSAREVQCEELPFDAPGYILFSSGTTGAPKCILHSGSAALLENLKAITLQFDINPGDRVYIPCTTSWVVWHILIFHLARGAAIVLYDGSPFYPYPDQQVRHTAAEHATCARWAARYVETLMKANFRPGTEHDLSALRTIMCNGSVFSADGYEWVYSEVKQDIHLISPSGGTDSFGSLVSNDPTGPVWAGEIQRPALGFDTAVFNDAGNPIVGTPGELVVRKAFPSMPLCYLGDSTGERYRDAYFSYFPGVWRHGDWAQVTEHGGFVIFGRSDATLNAGGVRIGTAEVYRQVATIHEINESAIVAQEWDGDTRTVLFVKLRPGINLNDELRARIKKSIRDNVSPRHIPAKIIAVPEFPLTVTGKISEVAVREAIHGRAPRNRDVLANPAALAHFAPSVLPELSTDH
jgi:acetoacetyl-CoA synthetase